MHGSETILADLRDRLAIITGGASGIGLACAQLLSSHGARVVIADRNEGLAASMAQRLQCAYTAIDVAEQDSVEKAAQAVRQRHGTADILVNSAGILQRTLPPDQLSIAEWDRVLNVNFRGTYLCCKTFGDEMARRGGGAIVNVASVAGMRSAPLHSYAPAKAAVLNLTECLAAEWGPRGVRVNAVSPGFTATPALDKAFTTGRLTEGELKAGAALQRLVAADEVAAAIVFLCSSWAAAITGVNLPVDGGYLAALPWRSYGGLRGQSEVSPGAVP